MNILTKQEKNTLFFLLTIIFTGIGMHYFIKSHCLPVTITSLSRKAATINLNTAGEETLMLIPGIGKTLARRIIVYRREHGGFSDFEQLKQIKGITEKRYEQICSESALD